MHSPETSVRVRDHLSHSRPITVQLRFLIVMRLKVSLKQECDCFVLSVCLCAVVHVKSRVRYFSELLEFVHSVFVFSVLTLITSRFLIIFYQLKTAFWSTGPRQWVGSN